MPESRSSPRRIVATEKQRQALELRKAGATFSSIAEALGYSNRQGAHLAVEAALKKTLQEPADQLRRLDVERLDSMLLAIWPDARRGNLDHIDMVLKILSRKAKLLGLDAPVKQEVTGAGGGPVRIQPVLPIGAEVLAEAARILEGLEPQPMLQVENGYRDADPVS